MIKTKLDRGDFDHAIFSGVNAQYSSFSNASMHRAVAIKANFTNTNFTDAKMDYANFRAANFTQAILRDASLMQADFTDAILKNSDLSRANLINAKISTKQLDQALLCKTILPNGKISNRDCTLLHQADLNLIIAPKPTPKPEHKPTKPSPAKQLKLSKLNLTATTKIVFLGDMFELGDSAKEEHQFINEYITSLDIDKVYLIGENFGNTISTNKKTIIYTTFEALKANFPELKNSNLLIKGSRGMALERILELL